MRFLNGENSRNSRIESGGRPVMDREAELEAALEKSARAGIDLLAKLEASKASETRLRSHLEAFEAREESESQRDKDMATMRTQYDVLRTKHDDLDRHHQTMQEELREMESEVGTLEKENMRLAHTVQQHETNATMMQARLHALETDKVEPKQSATESFSSVTKEQLRNELLEAGLGQQKMEQRIQKLEEEKSQLGKYIMDMYFNHINWFTTIPHGFYFLKHFSC